MESAHFWNCVGRCSQVRSDDDCEECVVAMHISPIKGTAQVTFKVVDGTEPTQSMPMLVAKWPRTAAGEVVPLTSDGDDWYLKVLINNENVFIRIGVWAACHECSVLGSMLEPGERGKENHASVDAGRR